MKHTPKRWIANSDGCKDVDGIVMLPIQDEEMSTAFVALIPVRLSTDAEPWAMSLTDANLIALAPTAPHECDPECPGDQNRRKLEAFDELLEALQNTIQALEHWTNIPCVDCGSGHDVGDHPRFILEQGKAAIAKGEACTKT